MAVGMHADVTVVDRSLPRLRQLDAQFNGRVRIAYSTAAIIEALVVESDLVIGTVLIPGAAAPKVVTRAMLKKMKPGSVLVDVSIDQGVSWSKLGQVGAVNTLPNVPVVNLAYNPQLQVLAAATLGRGFEQIVVVSVALLRGRPGESEHYRCIYAGAVHAHYSPQSLNSQLELLANDNSNET